MVIAYAMIKANTGEADRLRDTISGVDGVIDVNIVAGDIDIIAKLEVDTPADVKNVVANTIQGTGGVENTQTYIAME